MSKRTYCADDKCEFEVYNKDEIDESIYKKNEANGYRLNNIDLSLVKEKGVYVFGNDVTDTQGSGGNVLGENVMTVVNREAEGIKVVTQYVNSIMGNIYKRDIEFTDDVATNVGSWITYNLNNIKETVVLSLHQNYNVKYTPTFQYPSGYNKDNCVVISLLIKDGDDSNNSWETSDTTAFYVGDNLRYQNRCTTTMGYSSITLTDWYRSMRDSNESVTYKLTLMKIS